MIIQPTHTKEEQTQINKIKRRISKYSFTKKITKTDGERLFIELPKKYIKKANINKEKDEFKVMKICQDKEKQKQQ